MLLGEQGGGHQQRHLFAVVRREKRGTQCHLGLAEANVAAYQPVHGTRRLQVAQHFVDDARLVGCFFKREGGGKGLVMIVRRREGMPGAALAQRLHFQKLHGDVPGLLARAPLGLVPGIPAQLVQRRLIRMRAGITRDPCQIRDRYI